MTHVTVVLDWDVVPDLTVEETGAGLRVTASPGLSEHQMARACEDLGAQGDHIHQAWREAVGLTNGGGVSASWAS